MFVANVAFGRFHRGAEIPRDEFTANELAQLELDGYIVENNPSAATNFAQAPQRKKARKADDAVLQPPPDQP